MKARSTYFIKKYVIPTILWLAGLFAWIEFFAKPFIVRATSAEGSWSSSILDLFSVTPAAFGWPLSGYLFLIISLLVLLVTIIFVVRPIRYLLEYLEISESPISIIHSEYTLTFNEDWSECQCQRVQYVHANRPNVNAYHYKLTPYYGTIDVKEIKSDISGVTITRLLRDNSHGKTREYIEEFGEQLPLSFFITYFPDKWVYWTHLNWGWFRNTLIRRVVHTIERNEYNHGKPTFEIEARYPVSGLKISLRFPEADHPTDSDVKAYFIDEGALRELIPYSGPENGHRKFSIECGQLSSGQKLRLSWSKSAQAH